MRSNDESREISGPEGLVIDPLQLAYSSNISGICDVEYKSPEIIDLNSFVLTFLRMGKVVCVNSRFLQVTDKILSPNDEKL